MFAFETSSAIYSFFRVSDDTEEAENETEGFGYP